MLYYVQPGDNLIKIAKRFNTTIDDILEVNVIDNPDLIFVGQVLKIPESKIISNVEDINMDLSCLSAILMDQKSGRILYSKNENKRLSIASLTKIMTAIIAIENGNLNDLVYIPEKVKFIPGSVVPLPYGKSICLEELLYGLMLCSGNDAAYVIAEYLGKKVENFIKRMNNQAVKIGAINTSFANPDGFDHKNHFSTAKDLSKIASYAMNNDVFTKIVSTKEASSGINGVFTKSYKNRNKLLFIMDHVDGIKTGYTPTAGECLAASVKYSNGRLISVVLNSKNRWEDTKKLLSFFQETYK